MTLSMSPALSPTQPVCSAGSGGTGAQSWFPRRGTVPHIGLPCLCTPALLQASSDEGGMLSTRLAWGPRFPPGAGGSGGRAGWARARLALPVLSPICDLSQEHSPSSCKHLAVGMEFTSPALSLLPPDVARCPGLGVESPQALAPQQPWRSHPFT